jgi:hypothetical protein
MRSSATWIIGGLLVLSALAARDLKSETSVERSESTRVLLAFRVNPQAAQSFLPEGWSVQPQASGPAQGANVYVVFTERLTEQTSEGASREGTRYAAFAIPATNASRGKSGAMVVRQLSDLDSSSTGPYRNTRPAQIERRAALEAPAASLGTGSESWKISAADGGAISVDLRFVRAVPRREQRELRAYSTADSSIERIYRLVEVSDVVYSVASKLDRVQERRIAIEIPELRTLFDGTQELRSIIVQPVYSREVLVP